jgi:hypothetical protein
LVKESAIWMKEAMAPKTATTSAMGEESKTLTIPTHCGSTRLHQYADHHRGQCKRLVEGTRKAAFQMRGVVYTGQSKMDSCRRGLQIEEDQP